MPEEVERPIKTAKEDRLQRREFVQRLVSALVDTKSRATGMVLGITGPWGSGKSSIINMVAETTLKQHTNIVVVQFNPWLINSRDDLITSFFAEVTVALSAAGKNTGATQLKGKLTGLAQTFFDYGKRLAPIGNLMLPGAGSAAAAGLDALSRTVSGGTTLYDLRRRFEHQLEESKTEVMVLIDEIDRLTNAEIAVVAQLVRAIADFPHFSYLLAYDADRVAEALGGGNHERGQAYLEKIVQLSIPLPLILPGQIKLVIQSRFSDLIDFPEDHEQRLKELLDALVPSIVSTFRDAKRLVGVFEVLYRSLCFEVNEVDLLGWAAVLTKYPHLEQVLRRHREQIIGPDWKLFGEPLLDSMIQENYTANIPTEVLSYGQEMWLEFTPRELLLSGPHVPDLKKLIEFLFKPRDGGVLDQWIGFGLPLTKVLTFGVLITESEDSKVAAHPRYVDVIQEIGKKNSNVLTDALRRAEANGNLAEYLVAMQGCGSRAHLDPVGQIWPSFSAFAEFVPALTDPPREKLNRLLAKFLLGRYLASLGPFRMFVDSNLDVIRRWIAEGHLSLAGHLLELQIKHRQLVSPMEESPSFHPFIDEENLAPLCAELEASCRAALFQGRLIDSIADLACLRAVLTGSKDGWDDNCRQKLDELLDQPTQLDRFVWYCYGEEEPGVGHVRWLIADRQLLRTRVNQRLESRPSAMPEQVRSAYINARSRTLYFDYDAPQPPTRIEPSAVNDGNGRST